MYCKPSEGNSFSYGLIIKDVDVEGGTFRGGSIKKGKYKVENGRLEYETKTGRLNISYDEAWSNGQSDTLHARVKSNSKFQCESVGGFEQKASNVLNLPDNDDERTGDHAEPGIKKYYIGDQDVE